ncbi:MAG: DUF4836 family protein [Bacteroides sp.]|nr:DUF4836 family protein [Roseburia sp.]MCM1347438.1 DUF4836 family protein [Bacteroides sp.]MCM1421207.1 DUF4836 family protein [Bacteroides sp.]
MRTIRLLLIVCVAVCMVSSCKKSEYINVIPADATLVVSADLKSMAEKGDVANSQMLGLMDSYMGLVVSGDEKQKLADVLSAPDKTGLDFTSPLYLFKTKDEFVGMVLRISSESKFDDFVDFLSKQGFCSRPVERDGLKWSSLLEDIDFAYNESSVLFLTSLGDEGGAMCKVLISEMYAAGEEESFQSTDHYLKMLERDKDVVAYSNIGVLPASFAEKLKVFLPSDVRSADVEVVASLDFSDGKAVLSAELYSDNDKVSQLLSQKNGNLRKIEGRYIDSPAEDFFVWGCVGIQGQWLLNTLKQDKEIRQMLFLLECGIDVEMMIKAIDGDVAVVLPNSFVTSDTNEPDYIIMANVKNTDFMADVDYWRKSMGRFGIEMNATGKDTYLLNTGKYELQWGVEDDNLFFATPEAYRQNAFSPRSEVLRPYTENIKNSVLYLYVNLEPLPLREIAVVTGMGSLLEDKLSGFESVILRVEDTDKFELSVCLKDKKTNFLKTLLN